jgi:hypothetical protein
MAKLTQTTKKSAAAKPATSKPTGKQAAPPRDPKVLSLPAKQGEAMPQVKARAATKASVNAALVVNAFQGNIMGKDVDIGELVTEMQTKFKDVKDGDLSTLEAMLVGQATALQSMFTSLAMRAASQEQLKQYQMFMTLALKAQAQSRATISALVDLKYPKQAATFVKQANMTTGPQQVNNGAIPNQYAQAHAHTGNIQSEQNKLLEGSKDEVATCRDRFEYAGQNRTLVQHA